MSAFLCNIVSMHSKIFNYSLFALGFRPFFMLAGLSALLLMLVFNAVSHGQLTGSAYFPLYYWHAHEMLLGYTTAVIAGFLLTAVRNWTGLKTLNGGKLAGLCLLWLYGRVVPFYAGVLPNVLIALIDFAFLPVLAWHLFTVLWHAKQMRNLLFIALLAMMALGNGLMHAQVLNFSEDSAAYGLQLVTASIVVMILVLAGRVFPFFTERGLPGTFAIRNPQLDALAICCSVGVFALQLSGISGSGLAITALLAVAFNSLRVSGWYSRRIWYVPLLWVLYSGYGWIIMGFVLTALAAYQWIAPNLALHAFTLGGIGILTLGMMARVSLAHTGRPLKVPNVMAIAFVILNLATVVRVLLPIALPKAMNIVLYSATLLWLAVFALFMFVSMPILTQPRVDGQEG